MLAPCSCGQERNIAIDGHEVTCPEFHRDALARPENRTPERMAAVRAHAQRTPVGPSPFVDEPPHPHYHPGTVGHGKAPTSIVREMAAGRVLGNKPPSGAFGLVVTRGQMVALAQRLRELAEQFDPGPERNFYAQLSVLVEYHFR